VVPPVIERELRVALTRTRIRAQWVKLAWITGGLTLWFLLMAIAAHPAGRSTGRTLFIVLFVAASAGVIMRGFGLTADLFSEERRNGTLGLLVLTGLRPLEIFAHKLTGAVILAAYGLLGMLPFFAVPFLMGGVSGAQFVCGLVFLFNTLFFCVAIGLLGSVLHKEGGQAQITSTAIAVILALAVPALVWVEEYAIGSSKVHPNWLSTSPGYAAWLVLHSFSRGWPPLFWDCSLVTAGYSVAALAIAAFVLSRTWRETPEGARATGWWGRLPGVGFARTVKPRIFREGWLAHDALCWMAARDRRPVVAGAIFAAVVALLWLAIWGVAGRDWLGSASALVASVILHVGLNWIIGYSAAKRLGEDRQSGGFEVILTLPVNTRVIVESQNAGLVRQFKGLFLTAAALDLFFASSAFAAGVWDVIVAGVYLAAWATLILLWYAWHVETASRAMWIAAWTGRPAYAALQAIKANVWLFFWIWFLWRIEAGARAQENPVVLGISAFFLGLLALGVLSSRGQLREKLIAELRLIAVAPAPARGDKRFKKWDPKQIHPPGVWAALDVLPIPHIPRSRRGTE
jgi:ABC-type transport system involved in multi-copper enzyme maturation permease subunit